ncbi:MAG: carbohydrate binding domain-containing protein [Thermoguttaceae bacterium]|nr:carbohydrate binding domain-containing protein [Thermoguttaceae bacterium]
MSAELHVPYVLESASSRSRIASHPFWQTLLVAWVVSALAPAAWAANLVANPSFEDDADGDGMPDGWQVSGNANNVEQRLRLDRGRDGRRSARLDCTRFTPGGPAAHAMICQMGVPVKRGTLYRVAFWARAENLDADVVQVALSDTAGWHPCGLQDVFIPTDQWARYEFTFRAVRDCGKSSRFQIWFNSTGTLWLDDVTFDEAPAAEAARPGRIVTAQGRANRIPNASFECGADGWGSAEWDRRTHWGGPMNALFGQIDQREHYDGHHSLRIDLSPENQPVSYFDYYELSRVPIFAPLAANLGWIEVEPGREHVFSAYLKAAAANTPALLAVREFQGRSFSRPVRVGTSWQRQSLVFTPSSRWCYVLAGPDLRKTPENPSPPQRATVWLDALQLEAAREPTAFVRRQAVELGVTTDRPGNVVQEDEAFVLSLCAANADAKARRVQFHFRFTDFFDREVFRNAVAIDVPAAGSAVHSPVYSARNLPECSRGFYRVHARIESEGVSDERTLRLAIIPKPREGDSRFGVNHAYPWPHLLDLSRKAGLVWVRDWSLKWQEVEPEQGRFTFAETDFQINRPLRHGLQVLGLLPFPSSNWSSSAPASVPGTGGYPQNRARVAYAPRDLGEFENYVARTVGHYKDRIRWWQVFNEPLYTDYSLPRSRGYTGADYARLTAAFARAARRADPGCKVLAGIGGIGDGQMLDDFKAFFAAGGLEAADAIDIHHYPTLRPPEFLEGPLARLVAAMEQHGPRKPIWMTEYGYYADDEPWAVPMPHEGFNRPLPSEQVQAEYAVRWAVIALAGGVEKIFYHAGTCGGVNSDSLQGVFYEYGGQPHKIYAAQAVMAHLLAPTMKFQRRLPLGEGVRAYLFGDGKRFVAVIWAPRKVKPKPIRLGAKAEVLDLVGRRVETRQLTPSGTPVYVTGEAALVDQVFNPDPTEQVR